MAAITTQVINDSGITVVYTALESTSNTFTNTGYEFIALKLASGDFAGVTITVTSQVTAVDTQAYGMLTKSNATDSLTQGQTIFIGPFPVGAFSDAEGNCTFTVSGISGVTAAVFSLTT